MLKILSLFLVSLLSLAVYLAIDIYSFADVSHHQTSDAAVVLGAAVWGDRPSPVFRERINHAVNLYKQGWVKKIIFTGGLAQGDTLAESEAAQRYAQGQGVPEADILIETRSRTTCDNLLQAKVIMLDHKLEQVLIVSDPMHMRRAILLAEDLQLKALPSPTPTSRYLSASSNAAFLLREMYFYLPYFFGFHHCI